MTENMAPETPASPATAAPSPDGLTVALAEYQYIRDVLILATNGATSRFNFYLLSVAAGVAGLTSLTVAKQQHSSRLIAAAAILSFLALLGTLTFARLVQFAIARHEYVAMLDAVRTYLLTRAPDVQPYDLLPVVGFARISPNTSRFMLANLSLGTAVINSAVLAALVSVAGIVTHLPIWVISGMVTAGVIATGYLHWSYQRTHTGPAYRAVTEALLTVPRTSPRSQ